MENVTWVHKVLSNIWVKYHFCVNYPFKPKNESLAHHPLPFLPGAERQVKRGWPSPSFFRSMQSGRMIRVAWRELISSQKSWRPGIKPRSSSVSSRTIPPAFHLYFPPRSSIYLLLFTSDLFIFEFLRTNLLLHLVVHTLSQSSHSTDLSVSFFLHFSTISLPPVSFWSGL